VTHQKFLQLNNRIMAVSAELKDGACIHTCIYLRNAVKAPMVVGTSPVNALRSISNVTRSDRSPIDVGMVLRRTLSFNRMLATVAYEMDENRIDLLETKC
jgi:hypothetical protein